MVLFHIAYLAFNFVVQSYFYILIYMYTNYYHI